MTSETIDFHPNCPCLRWNFDNNKQRCAQMRFEPAELPGIGINIILSGSVRLTFYLPGIMFMATETSLFGNNNQKVKLKVLDRNRSIK